MNPFIYPQAPVPPPVHQPRPTRVTCLSARVRSADPNGKSDPYVAIQLWRNGQMITSKTSHFLPETLTPIWNFSTTFNLTPSDTVRFYVYQNTFFEQKMFSLLVLSLDYDAHQGYKTTSDPLGYLDIPFAHIRWNQQLT